MNFKNLVNKSLVLLTCITMLAGGSLEAYTAKRHKKGESTTSSDPIYDITTCPHPNGVTYPIYASQAPINGTVTISNTASQITVSANVSQTNYKIEELHVFIAPSGSSCDRIPLARGNPKIGHFTFYKKYAPSATQITFPISVNSIPCYTNTGGCYKDMHMVVVLDLRDSHGNSHTAFAKGSSGACWSGSRWGYCLMYRMCLDTTPPTVSAGDDVSKCSGETATLSGNATDSAMPITYQWKKGTTTLTNSGRISGANSNTLTITGTITTDTGIYSLCATDACGNTACDDTNLAICDTPQITEQPQDQTVNAGQSATFSVAVAGAGPFSYQWRRNGTAINEAIDSSYTTPPLSFPNSDYYDVVVTNCCSSSKCCSVTSQKAYVDVLCTENPVSLGNDQTVCEGTSSLTLNATLAEGWNTVEWYFDDGVNGPQLIQSGENSYTISPVEEADQGTYTVTAADSYGCENSASVVVSVCDLSVIITQPTDVQAPLDSQASLTVIANGACEYQWYKDDEQILGATSNTLTFDPVEQSDVGSYYVVITSCCDDTQCTVQSNTVTLSIACDTPKVGDVIDNSRGRCVGDEISMYVVDITDNYPIISTQWQKDGEDLVNDERISGADTEFLNIRDAQTSDTGFYRLKVTNNCGGIGYSDELLVIICNKPTITQQPEDQTVPAGTTATFSVSATADGTLYYRWLKDGDLLEDSDGKIAGATTATLSVYNFTEDDLGSYSVDVFNCCNPILQCCGVSSDAVTVCISPNVFELGPNNIPVLQGDSTSLIGSYVPLPAQTCEWFYNNLPLIGASCIPDETGVIALPLNNISILQGEEDYKLVFNNPCGTSEQIFNFGDSIIVLSDCFNTALSLDGEGDCNGSSYKLHVQLTDVEDNSPYFYQWYFQRQSTGPGDNPTSDPIYGAITDSYTIPAGDPQYYGTYTVYATDKCGNKAEFVFPPVSPVCP